MVGYRNIAGETYAGDSGVHPFDGNAVDTTNGAGPHNLQIFILAGDGTVLTCLPGFWNKYDLLEELKLAEKLNALHCDRHIQGKDKAALAAAMHLAHAKQHGEETTERSHLQGFDQRHIYEQRNILTDCIKDSELLQNADEKQIPTGAFKTTDQIYHERMSKIGLLPYEKFDLPAYTNYGTSHYDRGESEASPHEKLALKGKSLQALTRRTTAPASSSACSASSSSTACSASASSSSCSASSSSSTCPASSSSSATSAPKQDPTLPQLNAAIGRTPNRPELYEARALWFSKRGLPEQAHIDACRALWLGSRNSETLALKKAMENYMARRKASLSALQTKTN